MKCHDCNLTNTEGFTENEWTANASSCSNCRILLSFTAGLCYILSHPLLIYVSHSTFNMMVFFDLSLRRGIRVPKMELQLKIYYHTIISHKQLTILFIRDKTCFSRTQLHLESNIFSLTSMAQYQELTILTKRQTSK